MMRRPGPRINGRGFKAFEWNTTGLPIIRIQNLNGSDDFNSYSGRFDPKIKVDPGQLLFAWSGSSETSFGPHIWNGLKDLLTRHFLTRHSWASSSAAIPPGDMPSSQRRLVASRLSSFGQILLPDGEIRILPPQT